MSEPRREIFGPHLEGLRRRPYEVYRHFRESDPVHWAGVEPGGRGTGAWYLFRHRDAVAALKSPALGRRPASYLPPGRLGATMAHWLVFLNPPDHTRVRSTMQRAFTPTAVRRLEAAAHDAARQLVADASAGARVDLVDLLASPLPLLTIARLLGVATGDLERFRRWSHALAPCLDIVTSPQGFFAAAEAAGQMRDFLAAAAAERRRVPQDDLLTELVREGDDGAAPLDDDELLANCVFLLAAGHETTLQVLATGVEALLADPVSWRRLREEPELIPNAVEELLRWEAPVQITYRDVLAETSLAGVELRPGHQVGVVLGAANRDPERFPDPDRLDIARPEARHHLSFASGIHYCLGAPLARMEIAAGLAALLDRWPGLELDGPARRRPGILLRGIDNLPVRLAA